MEARPILTSKVGYNKAKSTATKYISAHREQIRVIYCIATRHVNLTCKNIVEIDKIHNTYSTKKIKLITKLSSTSR